MSPPPYSPALRAFRSTDWDQVEGLDTSFSTNERYVLRRNDDQVTLLRVPLEAPISKAFPREFGVDSWDHGFVCTADDQLYGFIGGEVQQWNRRLVVWHFYVDKRYRLYGIGRALMNAMLSWGRACDASLAWVETSNLNVPGVLAYERLGFQICGFDESLYTGTPNHNEFALFMSRPLER